MQVDDLGAQEPTQIDLETLKEATTVAMLAIRKGKEPTHKLEVIRDAINEAIQSDRMATDPDFATYLNETLGLKVMPAMARERSIDENVSVLPSPRIRCFTFAYPSAIWPHFFHISSRY